MWGILPSANFSLFFTNFYIGRMYDKYGNYGTLWWTQKSVEQYEKRSACMIDQYSQFSYFNKKVSGKFFLLLANSYHVGLESH